MFRKEELYKTLPSSYGSIRVGISLKLPKEWGKLGTNLESM